MTLAYIPTDPEDPIRICTDWPEKVHIHHPDDKTFGQRLGGKLYPYIRLDLHIAALTQSQEDYEDSYRLGFSAGQAALQCAALGMQMDALIEGEDEDGNDFDGWMNGTRREPDGRMVMVFLERGATHGPLVSTLAT